MQKLEKRNTYTPLNTVPVQCNCDPLLNNPLGVLDSVMDSKTFSNISEEHLHSGMSGHNLQVYVLNMRGESLMPITPCKARKLTLLERAKGIIQEVCIIPLLPRGWSLPTHVR
ncbi:MAG: hypothetical protein GQ469_07150 [Methanosarcinales archaeon]|nr:hypothetical protein [Methanosarcinales archaeon]